VRFENKNIFFYFEKRSSLQIQKSYDWLLGSMLWSQFSAIFGNFLRKNWRFSQKPMLWLKFCIF
jgi:hypothetical protein